MTEGICSAHGRPGCAQYHWPLCDHRGCYEKAAIDRNVVKHFGTNFQPVRIVLHDGETYHFCPGHLRGLRDWIERRRDTPDWRERR